MNIIGILGIAIGLALLIFLAFKGFEVAYIAIIAVIVVALCNHLDIMEAVGGTMLAGAGEFFTMMGGMFLTSCVFAGIFSACGAAQSLANGFVWFFNKILEVKKKESYGRGVLIILFVSYFSYTILTFFGLDGMSAEITLVPIIIAMMKSYNIPRHCAPVLLYMNVSSVFLPYSLQVSNLMPARMLGTSSSVGGWQAVIIWLLSVMFVFFYMYRYINKAHNRGDQFVSMPMDEIVTSERKLPVFILALFPLILVFVLYTVVKWDIAVVLLIAAAFTMATMFPFFKSNAVVSGKKPLELLKEKMTTQVGIAAKILIIVCFLVGFGSVVQSTAVFGQIISALTNPAGSITVICALAIMVVILVSCNPVAGEAVALSVLSKPFIAAGVPASVFHRLTVIASTTFDSLPTGLGVIMAHELTGVKMKDGYKPIFVVTVIVPFIGTLILSLLYTWFPIV